MQSNPFFDLDLFNNSETANRMFFNSFLPTGATPTQARGFQNLFSPTFNTFLGQMGSQIRAGQTPQQSFTDFLQDQFDPVRELLRISAPSQAGAPGSTIFRFNR